MIMPEGAGGAFEHFPRLPMGAEVLVEPLDSERWRTRSRGLSLRGVIMALTDYGSYHVKHHGTGQFRDLVWRASEVTKIDSLKLLAEANE